MSYAASRLDWGCGMGGRGVGRRGSAQGKEKRYPVRNMCRGSLSLIYIYTYIIVCVCDMNPAQQEGSES